MDRSIEAVPLKEMTADVVSSAFYDIWVSRYGVPLRLTSDRGLQFRSELYYKLCKLLGVKFIRTTSYNPKANGLIERWHRVLKNNLKCRGNRWVSELPTVFFGLRAVPIDASGISCAELIYGRILKLPGEFYGNSIQSMIICITFNSLEMQLVR